jgi:hypothetical protein
MARKNCAKWLSNVTGVSSLRKNYLCVCVCGLAVAEVYISEGFGFYCYPIIAIYLKEVPNRCNIFYLRYELTRRPVYDNSVSLSTYLYSIRYILPMYCKDPKILARRTKLQACVGGRWGGERSGAAVYTCNYHT